MQDAQWNKLKSQRLKLTRGVSFEEIIQGRLVGVEKNAARENQNFYLIEYRNYIWVVPYVQMGSIAFLKTLYPSRKYTKIYLKGDGTLKVK